MGEITHDMPRVVITGIKELSPLGSLDAHRHRLSAGISGY